MHEYGITQNIINMVIEEANKNNAKQVTSINIVIGELSGIIDQSVQMYFDMLASDTICHGARLVFTKQNAILKCTACQNMFERNPKTFDCPKCGGTGRLTDKGKEFYIESIEVV